MRTPEFIQRCMDAGIDLATALTAAKAFEAECEIALEELLETKRAKERARQAKHRAKVQKDNENNVMSRDVTLDDVTSVNERDLTGEPAQVVNTTSSLRSEGTQEANASFVDASKPADPEKPKTKPPKASRGTRLPEDWEPSEADVDAARKQGLTDEEISRATIEFRNYWCARTRDATKLSWHRTWENRVCDIGDRKRRYGPRLVASSGQSAGGGRGAVSFADIFARRHGLTSD